MRYKFQVAVNIEAVLVITNCLSKEESTPFWEVVQRHFSFPEDRNI